MGASPHLVGKLGEAAGGKRNKIRDKSKGTEWVKQHSQLILG